MAESVAELLGRLRFVGGPVETLYLNQPRVRESFVGQLGAIESFTRGVEKEGSVEAPVIKIACRSSIIVLLGRNQDCLRYFAPKHRVGFKLPNRRPNLAPSRVALAESQ